MLLHFIDNIDYGFNIIFPSRNDQIRLSCRYFNIKGFSQQTQVTVSGTEQFYLILSRI